MIDDDWTRLRSKQNPPLPPIPFPSHSPQPIKPQATKNVGFFVFCFLFFIFGKKVKIKLRKKY